MVADCSDSKTECTTSSAKVSSDDPKMCCKLLPEGYKPTNLDIVCGRGKGYLKHEGNIRFSTVIQANLQRYARAPRRFDKSLLVVSIVDYLRATGARFIKLDRKTKRWYDIEDQAHEKTGHAIRDQLSSLGLSLKKQTKPRQKIKSKIPAISHPEIVTSETQGQEGHRNQMEGSGARELEAKEVDVPTCIAVSSAPEEMVRGALAGAGRSKEPGYFPQCSSLEAAYSLPVARQLSGELDAATGGGASNFDDDFRRVFEILSSKSEDEEERSDASNQEEFPLRVNYPDDHLFTCGSACSPFNDHQLDIDDNIVLPEDWC